MLSFFICFVYLIMYLYFPVCLLFVLYNKFILSWFYCFFFNIYVSVKTPVMFKITTTTKKNTWGFNLEKNYLLWRYWLFWRLPRKETKNTRKSFEILFLMMYSREGFSHWLYLNYLKKDLADTLPPAPTHNHIKVKTRNTFILFSGYFCFWGRVQLILFVVQIVGDNHCQNNKVFFSLCLG